MGLRFRKSITICKGLKLNLGKTGASLTVGNKGFHKTFHTSGKVTTTVGIPGTGVYWTETENTSSSTSRSSAVRDDYDYSDTYENYDEGTAYNSDYDTETSSIAPTPQQSDFHNTNYLSATDIDNIFRVCDPTIEWTEILAGTSSDELLMDSEVWKYCRTVADRVLSGDIDAYLEVIEKLRPVDDLLLYAGDFEFGTDKSDLIEVEARLKPEEVLKNGSDDALFEEFTYAVAIRIARDLMALLPVSGVYVNIVINGNGVLSAKIKRSEIARVNFKVASINDIKKLHLKNTETY